jgi:hypothetical protein
MASIFTTNLNLEKPAFRDYVDAWHNVMNANFDKIDESVSRLTDTISRHLFVDSTRTDIFTPNGTRAKPYKLVQEAVNYVEANLNPDITNPVTILIMPCDHIESIIIKKSGVNLQGLGVCRIKTNSGVNTRPALTISNATISSLNSFFANDGRNNPSTAYSNLIADISFPVAVEIKNIEFGDSSVSNVNDIMILGAGTNIDFLISNAKFSKVVCYSNFYIRNSNYVQMFDNSLIHGNLVTFNIAKFLCEYSIINGNVEMSYNIASPQPSDTSNYGFNGGPVKIRGSLMLSGSAKCGDDLFNVLLIGNIDLDNTSNCKINSIFINGDINVEGNATFIIKNMYLQGSLNLSDLEGTTPCILDGSQVLSGINDPSNRLIWHDYDPAVADDWAGTPPRTIKDAIDRLASKVAAEHGTI